MSETIQDGLALLMIGMITVFSVLTIVVLTGRMLIYSLNRVQSRPETRSPSVRTKEEARTISRRKLAAITIATQLMTEGSGRVARVERIES
ncbi:MAG: OadG family protein [Saprospiraceae bacterium]|nr:OadG family protein [Saprospiraceae bacterium]